MKLSIRIKYGKKGIKRRENTAARNSPRSSRTDFLSCYNTRNFRGYWIQSYLGRSKFVQFLQTLHLHSLEELDDVIVFRNLVTLNFLTNIRRVVHSLVFKVISSTNTQQNQQVLRHSFHPTSFVKGTPRSNVIIKT